MGYQFMHFPINSCERPLFAAPCSRYFYDEIASVVHRQPSQMEREKTTTPGTHRFQQVAQKQTVLLGLRYWIIFCMLGSTPKFTFNQLLSFHLKRGSSNILPKHFLWTNHSRPTLIALEKKILTTSFPSSLVNGIQGAPITVPMVFCTRVICHSFVRKRDAAEVSTCRFWSTGWFKQEKQPKNNDLRP